MCGTTVTQSMDKPDKQLLTFKTEIQDTCIFEI